MPYHIIIRGASLLMLLPHQCSAIVDSLGDSLLTVAVHVHSKCKKTWWACA